MCWMADPEVELDLVPRPERISRAPAQPKAKSVSGQPRIRPSFSAPDPSIVASGPGRRAKPHRGTGNPLAGALAGLGRRRCLVLGQTLPGSASGQLAWVTENDQVDRARTRTRSLPNSVPTPKWSRPSDPARVPAFRDLSPSSGPRSDRLLALTVPTRAFALLRLLRGAALEPTAAGGKVWVSQDCRPMHRMQYLP